jgi:hypothetical protein
MAINHNPSPVVGGTDGEDDGTGFTDPTATPGYTGAPAGNTETGPDLPHAPVTPKIPKP